MIILQRVVLDATSHTRVAWTVLRYPRVPSWLLAAQESLAAEYAHRQPRFLQNLQNFNGHSQAAPNHCYTAIEIIMARNSMQGGLRRLFGRGVREMARFSNGATTTGTAPIGIGAGRGIAWAFKDHVVTMKCSG